MKTCSNLTKETKKIQRAGDTIFSTDCTHVFSVDYKQILLTVYCQEMNITENMQPRKIMKEVCKSSVKKSF